MSASLPHKCDRHWCQGVKTKLVAMGKGTSRRRGEIRELE